MARGYANELARWVTRSGGAVRDRHRVMFLAAADDVRSALAAGFAARTVWAHLREAGRIACAYETFLLHIDREIRRPPPPLASLVQAKPQAPPSNAAPRASDRPRPEPMPTVRAPRTGMPTFTFTALRHAGSERD